MKREAVSSAIRAYEQAIANHNTPGAKDALLKCLNIPDLPQADQIPAVIVLVPKEKLWNQIHDRPRDFRTAKVLAQVEALREARGFAGNFGEPTEKEMQHVRASVSRLLLLELMLDAVRGVNSFNPRNYRLVKETHPHPQAYLASKHAFQLMLPQYFNINIIEETGCAINRDGLSQTLEELSHFFEVLF